jgi:hypothetical protein
MMVSSPNHQHNISTAFNYEPRTTPEQKQRICTGFINHVLGSQKSAKNISTYPKKSLQDFIGCLHYQ